MQAELREGADGWQNADLASFPAAMAAWARDRPGPFDADPWRHAAALMRAGALHE